jgi:uncharacterized membrane protein
MNARTLHLLNGALVAVLVGASLLALPQLPERIPIHFGFGGTPTRWVRASLLAWLGLPAVAAATASALWLAGRWGRRSPSLWNVPEKTRFLQLSPEGRAPFVERLDRVMAWVGVATTSLFAAVQWAIFATATGRAQGLPGWFSAAVFLLAAAMVVLSIRANAGLAAEIRAAADAEGIPPPRWG